MQTFKTKLNDTDLVIETGKYAKQANGHVMVRYGDTVVMVNVTASKEPREGVDFFPLSVDVEEKLYSVGKIPGSYIKREGKPTDKAVLNSRAIDRPLRPLFPKDFRNDVCVVCTVLCVDQDNSPETAAMIGAATALAISDIPFNGPTAGIDIGLIDGKVIISPNEKQREKSDLTLTLAGTADKITMIEAGANEISNEQMLDAIKQGHEVIKELVNFIDSIALQVGKPKMEYIHFEIEKDILDFVHRYDKELDNALENKDKMQRDIVIDNLLKQIFLDYENEFGTENLAKAKGNLKEALNKVEKQKVRDMIFFEKRRVDGRKIDEIRELSCEVGILPRTHGSATFTRGLTQVMSIATLGMVSEEQKLDGIDSEESKRYIHHYNFPAYSVGEARPSRRPGRREIGHGALAEKALVPVLPSKEEFPYAIRVVSEVLSSNGSTSQGSICGSTLALMDAGVPIKRPVAGISTGLVSNPDNIDDYVMMLDIQGIEDFFGDMDFKVGGTKKGITAIQVDIKVNGLTYKIIEEAFEKTKKAREYILDEVMAPVISAPRDNLSKYAPRIISTKINPDKIKDVIGSGGKTINKIIEQTGVKIDIEDDGTVYIYSSDQTMGVKALEIIEDIVKEIEKGEIYTGKVTRITTFGAFVDLGIGDKEGMVHISQLSKQRVSKVTDVVNVGDSIVVKVIDIDDMGRINLTMNL